MSLWLLILVLGLIKVPLLGILFWMAFRDSDQVAWPQQPGTDGEDDGGSCVERDNPHKPPPRRRLGGPPPRRGDSGCPAPATGEHARSRQVGARRR